MGGLLMAGLALVLVYAARPSRAMISTARFLGVGVIALGGLSLLGHAFGLGFLFRALPFETMAPQNAAGFVALTSKF